MDCIQIRELTKSYGKARGVNDVNLNIKEGEIFGLIGPNGAGKSTLIRTMLNYIFPTKGSIGIFGLDSRQDTDRIKKDIGYIPSEVNFYDDMTVKQLLNYSAKFYKKNCTKKIEELSEIFELELNRKIEELSYGNKKKVAIVQALIHEPKLLILDEPTSGLDPLMQSKFFDILRQEKQRGTTILFSSHILSEVQKICDRVAIIKEGEIIKVENVSDLISNSVKKVYVEPKTPEVINSFVIMNSMNMIKNSKGIEFMYNKSPNELIKELIRYDLLKLIIEEPTLEEIFMHYYKSEDKEEAKI